MPISIKPKEFNLIAAQKDLDVRVIDLNDNDVIDDGEIFTRGSMTPAQALALIAPPRPKPERVNPFYDWEDRSADGAAPMSVILSPGKLSFQVATASSADDVLYEVKDTQAATVIYLATVSEGAGFAVMGQREVMIDTTKFAAGKDIVFATPEGDITKRIKA